MIIWSILKLIVVYLHTDSVYPLQGLYSSVVCPGLVMSNMTYRILPVFVWKLLMPIMWLVSRSPGRFWVEVSLLWYASMQVMCSMLLASCCPRCCTVLSPVGLGRLVPLQTFPVAPWGHDFQAEFRGLVPGDRTKDNRHKLKQRKFYLNMRKNFFPLRVTEPWHRLPREVVESTSLEIFKPCLDKVLCSLLWVTLLRQGGWTGCPTEVPSNPYHSVILWFL